MIELKKLSTLPPEDGLSKEEMKVAVEKMKQRLAELQDMLYAQHQFSVLVIVQGMDASGKDGLINHAFSGMNPAGIRVYSWKKPTETETKYDFLWRIHQAVPPKGMIHVFNRSQYEDILVPSVYKTLPETEIEKRYDMMNHFECLLTDSGTVVLKLYLHVSKKEQQSRMKDRMNQLSKQWKYDPADVGAIKLHDHFLAVYQSIFERCERYAPWHIVPSDKNTYKEYLTVKLLLEAMEKLPLAYPKIAKSKK